MSWKSAYPERMTNETEAEALGRLKATMVRVAYAAMVVALLLAGLWLLEQIQS